MNSQKVVVLLLSAGFFASASWADDFEFIVLTDNVPAPGDDLAEMRRSNPEAAQQRNKLRAIQKAKRREVLAVLRQTKKEMELHGRAFATDAQLAAYDVYITDDVNPQSVYEMPFGYRRTNLDHPVLKAGRLKGVYGVQESDGFVHQAAYVYDFDELGPVVIEELSFLTIPDARISVTRPIGNLMVNGFPASYTALTNRDYTKGLTGITFITDNKMFSVTAFRCVTRNDAELFEQLVSVANALN